MASRLVAFVFFASISSALAVLSPGIYQITNVQTHTSLQNYAIKESVVVGKTPAEVRFERWEILPISKSPPNFYSLQNEGSGGFAGLTSANPGSLVFTTLYAQVFNITTINRLSYMIKSTGADLAWSVDPISLVVKLQSPCPEQQSQQWNFVRVST